MMELFDLNSRRILGPQPLQEITEVDVSVLPMAVYVLKIYDPSSANTLEFKILKQ